MTLRLVQYDFQQCIMLHIALGNNVATGYKSIYKSVEICITTVFDPEAGIMSIISSAYTLKAASQPEQSSKALQRMEPNRWSNTATLSSNNNMSWENSCKEKLNLYKDRIRKHVSTCIYMMYSK